MVLAVHVPRGACVVRESRDDGRAGVRLVTSLCLGAVLHAHHLHLDRPRLDRRGHRCVDEGAVAPAQFERGGGAVGGEPKIKAVVGGGGFAEIMRKNKEAAEKKKKLAAGGGAVETSKGGSTAGSSSGGGGNNGDVDARLASIEAKLDKIIAHLGL